MMEFQLHERIEVCKKDKLDDVRLVIGSRSHLSDVFFITADAAGAFEEWPMNDCKIVGLRSASPKAGKSWEKKI